MHILTLLVDAEERLQQEKGQLQGFIDEVLPPVDEETLNKFSSPISKPQSLVDPATPYSPDVLRLRWQRYMAGVSHPA